MLRNNWPVEDHGIRPAGDPDNCFYCKAPKGSQHTNECVIRSRTVVVRTTIEHVIDVPEFWDQDLVNFHLNESSSCANNLIRRIAELPDRIGDSCTCELVESEFVREATAEDEEANQLFVERLPT